MKTAVRVLATATIGIGLAVPLAAPAQAGEPTEIIGGTDAFTWAPVGDECFYADVLANDTPRPQQVTDIRVLTGGVTAAQGYGPTGGTGMEVCPAVGFTHGDIAITYVPLAITGPGGGYLYGPDGNIGAISAAPVAVTITVVGPPEPTETPTPTGAPSTGPVEVQGEEAQATEPVVTQEDEPSGSTTYDDSRSGTSGGNRLIGIVMTLLGVLAPVGASILGRRR